jgi:hypothetical protein
MRKKLKENNERLNAAVPRPSPASSAASGWCPMTNTSVAPTSGTVTFDIIIGHASLRSRERWLPKAMVYP